MDGGQAQLVHINGLAGPVDLALDWIGRNLYVADRDTSRIELFSLTRKLQQNIVSNNLQSPTAIAIDSIKG